MSTNLTFSPDTSDYDAYGLKVAANDLLIVEAQNKYTQFLIQFAPYTDNIEQMSQSSCSVEYSDSSHYIYAVTLGKNQTSTSSQRYFFFVGEMLGVTETSLMNRTFVGILNYTGVSSMGGGGGPGGGSSSINCNQGFTYSIQYVTGSYIHQEHLVVTTDLTGSIAYGFSDLFTFTYTALTNRLIVHANNSISPSTSYLPYAVDFDGTYGVIAGFINNGRNSRIKYSPTVYLFIVNATTAVATTLSSWTYSTNGTWQSGQSFSGADLYTAKYDIPSGYYSSTTGSLDQTVPAFSTQMPCIAGTYKNATNIRPCSLCPSLTKNDGNSSTACTTCANNTFCPLGATYDISSDLLTGFIQAAAYPKSPENTIFDDILILNMFSIGSSSHCITVSPIFWAIIVAIIAFIVMLVMVLLKHYIRHPRAPERYEMLTTIFKQTDLIGEGELWIGGLLSFCILVLVIFAYIFSSKYYKQYPLETAQASTFACDTTILNAKFETKLQSLTIPLSSELQEMAALLNEQEFYLNVAFINTVFTCSDSVTLFYLLGNSWTTLSFTSCNYSSYILSLSALLPYKSITVRFNLPGINTIGGLRIGISGSGETESYLTLNDLNFSETFNQTEKMLGQDVHVAVQLTKVINETVPLEIGEETLSGLWVASLTLNYYDSFVSESDYLDSTLTETNVTLVLSETGYYILNEQQPIAKQTEIIFHNLLFTIVVLELFGLLFLLFKLLLLPLASFLITRCRPTRTEKNGNRVGDSGDLENLHDHHPNNGKGLIEMK
ncbi:unnamed protein product [Didymodactylos carnosus]|uniref:Uncharacterized protein n=1 Tax=Didymodactylos carnosus TaxID=1234261 RepID=A0A814UY48_9BILA|nr:unnamed protein product [Didymodactylos carnosus]CAF1183783.1 unnamed protein product [Didymodactylos carnosus]CAF3882043.1 unnamed protein product [Didymodactylos carnosus]CAF3948070.1 unnamed protein product [Didymodactylos carnosus]